MNQISLNSINCVGGWEIYGYICMLLHATANLNMTTNYSKLFYFKKNNRFHHEMKYSVLFFE